MHEDLDITNADGLKLHVRLYGRAGGEGSGLPLVCLAGLTRNGRDFEQIATALSGDAAHPRLVVAIDSRGRGGSDRDPDPSRYTLPAEAGDVVFVLSALGIGRADFIGTSRGGLILHVLAAMAPDLLGKLILNDIGPVIELDGMRQIQAYLDPAPSPRPREQVVSALARIHAATFPALGPQDWEEMADALYRRDKTGLMIPDFDPAISAQTRSLDLSQPLPHLWALFDQLKNKRVMLVRGEHSALLSRTTATEMQRRHPDLVLVEAQGQGHAPLLHKPDLMQAIRRFLDSPDEALAARPA